MDLIARVIRMRLTLPLVLFRVGISHTVMIISYRTSNNNAVQMIAYSLRGHYSLCNACSVIVHLDDVINVWFRMSTVDCEKNVKIVGGKPFPTWIPRWISFVLHQRSTVTLNA